MKHVTINNFSTALTSDITSSDTTITLDDVSRVPSAVSADTPMLMTLAPAGVALPTLSDVEIIEVTGVDFGNSTVTVNRGQDGATAKAFTSGDTVGARVTARMHNRTLEVATIEDQKAANASVDPRAYWLTSAPQNGYGPTSQTALAIGGYSKAGGTYSSAHGRKVKAAANYSSASGYKAHNLTRHSSAMGVDAAYHTGAMAIVHADSQSTYGASTKRSTYGLQIGPGGPSAVAFRGLCVAQKSGYSDSASWEFGGLAKLDGASTPALVGSNTTKTHYYGEGSGWTFGLSLYAGLVYGDVTGSAYTAVDWSIHWQSAHLHNYNSGGGGY